VSLPEHESGAPLVLVVANQKGGVGKTTTAINLATALAAVDKSTLVIDLDPQGNATTGLGARMASTGEGAYDVLHGAPLADALVNTAVPGLSLVPASADLSGIDIELVDEADRAYRLQAALQAPDIKRRFDVVLLDCPPSLSLLTINAMVAGDGLLVPLQCEFFALQGLSQLLTTVERVKQNLNKSLSIFGIVLTMYDGRNNLSRSVAEDVKSNLGDLVFETLIPRNVRLSEAPSYALPALLYDHACVGSQAYIRLAGEVLRRAAPRTKRTLETTE
jgi:chromosome partitioning protein